MTVSCHAIALTFSIKVSEETQYPGRTSREKLQEWYHRADEDLIGASARKQQEESCKLCLPVCHQAEKMTGFGRKVPKRKIPLR